MFGVAVGAAATGLMDNENTINGNSALQKAKDNLTQATNNILAGADKSQANLNAHVDAITDGDLTNALQNQDILNELKTKLTQNTTAKDTQVFLIENTTNPQGEMVQGLANPTKGHTYLDIDHLDNAIETLNHEIAHHNGQGETSATRMGKISDLAYNIGTSLNKEDIDNHRQGIITTAQTLQGLSTEDGLAYHAQNQAVLDGNKEQLEREKESGDGFENKTLTGQIAQNKYNYCATQGVSRENCQTYIRQQNLDNLGTAAEDVMVLASVYRGGVGRAPVRSTVTNSTPKTFIPNDKFNYFFGRVKSDPHNTPRSIQNKQQLASIGIHDNAQGRKIISDTVEDSVSSSTNITSVERKIGKDGLSYNLERRETLIIGSGGIRKLEMGFEIMPNGQRRLTTIIVKGGS